MVAPVTVQSGITIEGGITVGNVPLPPQPTLALNLDAAGYTSGPWVDTVNSLSFTLNGGVTYSASNGGCLVFDPASSQYAECSTSLSSLSTWSVVTWHYYTGTETGVGPCIVTEVFPSITNNINYSLGYNLVSAVLSAGYFNGSWQTSGGTSLTPNNWYQIVGTFDGTTAKLYINTVLVTSAVTSGSSPTSGGSGIRLMRRWDDTDYWGGKLGRVQVYDGAMTFGNITTDWNANRARFGL